MTSSNRPAFVCWIGHQGRSEDLARRLDADLWLLGTRSAVLDRPATAAVRYLVSAVRTTWRVVRERPSAFIVMQPPIFALVLVLVLAGRRPVVADLHHDPFEERRWRWSLRPTLWLARRCALVLVTNPVHAAFVTDAGARVAVLHDPPVRHGSGGAASSRTVVVPSSYSPDEPVDALFAAARRRPGVDFHLTGSAPAAVRAAAPSNVTFTGFVPTEDYHRLLTGARVVLCLTDKSNTMQRGGYEAMAHGRPLVTTDSQALRSHFGAAAVYCTPDDPRSIVDAIDDALEHRDELTQAMNERRTDIEADYDRRLRAVSVALADGRRSD